MNFTNVSGSVFLYEASALVVEEVVDGGWGIGGELLTLAELGRLEA
ncbi:hypothetical protein [Streptomyces sp. NBC_00996]|nr:hypothetical protein OG390_45100 [Streptomyces sp. NBC_00996]